MDRTDKLNRTELKIISDGLGHILILLFISQLLIEKELFFGVQGYVKHEGPSPTKIKLMPLHWEQGVLFSGSPGSSENELFGMFTGTVDFYFPKKNGTTTTNKTRSSHCPLDFRI